MIRVAPGRSILSCGTRWWVVWALLLAGCVHPLSKQARDSVDPTISLPQLFENPESQSGKRVILGGEIVETRNLPDKSEIEVVQKPVDSFGTIEGGDATLGRFLFVKPGYLEGEVFAKGRKVIGAGRIAGGQTGKLGEADYTYPVIEADELHLEEEYQYPPYYYDPFYPPFYYHPFHRHPFWGHPFYW